MNDMLQQLSTWMAYVSICWKRNLCVLVGASLKDDNDIRRHVKTVY